MSFQHDLAGRVVTQTLPDGRAIGFAYDASSNVTGLMPPGQPGHTFGYTPIDLLAQYTPPDVNPGSDATLYSYNPDRQMALITLPDGRTIDPGYDSAGRLDTLTIARGIFVHHYSPDDRTRQSECARYSHLCLYIRWRLLKSESLSGPVTGTVAVSYDTSFRVTSLDVNGSPIPYSYDQDSLLKQAGALTLTRDSRDGQLIGSTLGNITDTTSYDSFGERYLQRLQQRRPVIRPTFSIRQAGPDRDQDRNDQRRNQCLRVWL